MRLLNIITITALFRSAKAFAWAGKACFAGGEAVLARYEKKHMPRKAGNA